jgi:transcriptional regulator with XRE-family HTH domain
MASREATKPRSHIDLGKRVSLAIESSNLSQRVIAERCGVGESAVSKWVRGIPPGTRLLPVVASVLGLSAEYLLTGKETPDQRSVRRDGEERRALEAEVLRLRDELARIHAAIGQPPLSPVASRPSRRQS